MAKKVVGQVKLQCPGGEAKPGPPIGPVLGQHGVNIPMFIKDFNARTANMKGYIIPVVITVFSDKSFTYITKTPPTSILLMKAVGADKGSARPNKEKVGKLTAAKIEDIARQKLADLNTDDLESAIRTVRGTARSMGIDIEG